MHLFTYCAKDGAFRYGRNLKRLEFMHNSFAEHYIFRGGLLKPNRDTQVIRLTTTFEGRCFDESEIQII